MRPVPLLLFGLMCFTASCGPRFFYPNLDWLIPWYVEDYLPMDGEQEVSLRADLKKILSWHCQNELVRYSNFLRETAGWFKEKQRVDARFFEG